MRILLYNHLTDEVTTMGGTSQNIESQLLRQVPWLDHGDHGDLQDLIEELQQHQHYDVEVVNTEAEPNEVDKLLDHPLRAERLMALKLPGCTVEHLHQALEDADPGMAEAVLDHHLVNEDVLTQALAHPRMDIRLKALCHPLVTATHLEQALEDKDLPVLEAVVAHGRLAPEQILRLTRLRLPLYLKVMALQKFPPEDTRRLEAMKGLYADMELNPGAEALLNEHQQAFGSNLGQWLRQRLQKNLPQDMHEPQAAYRLPETTGAERGDSYVEDMVGHDLLAAPEFRAASFLAGSHREKSPTDASLRELLWEEDGDAERAALRAYGLEITDGNLVALRAALSVGGLGKAETALRDDVDPDDVPAVKDPRSIRAALPEGEDTAEAVREAFSRDGVEPIKLGGKHSKGTLVAEDRDHQAWLLKRGSGPQSPAAGARDIVASQSAREACFFHVARHWGLGEYLPHCDLLVIDGDQPWAAMKMLPLSFRNLEKRWKNSPMQTLWTLDRYRRSGTLFKWAILDYVLGNTDRHGQNCLMDNAVEPHIYLIDHGAAFAGKNFDPAHDKNSFVPFYLRAYVGKSFNKLAPEVKLRYMPRAGAQTEEVLHRWLDGLHADELRNICSEYGVDSAACLERLARLKSGEGPVDLRVNRLWVGV